MSALRQAGDVPRIPDEGRASTLASGKAHDSTPPGWLSYPGSYAKGRRAQL